MVEAFVQIQHRRVSTNVGSRVIQDLQTKRKLKPIEVRRQQSHELCGAVRLKIPIEPQKVSVVLIIAESFAINEIEAWMHGCGFTWTEDTNGGPFLNRTTRIWMRAELTGKQQPRQSVFLGDEMARL